MWSMDHDSTIHIGQDLVCKEVLETYVALGDEFGNATFRLIVFRSEMPQHLAIVALYFVFVSILEK